MKLQQANPLELDRLLNEIQRGLYWENFDENDIEQAIDEVKNTYDVQPVPKWCIDYLNEFKEREIIDCELAF